MALRPPVPEKTLGELQMEHALPPKGSADPRAGEHTEQSALRNYVRDLILGVNDGVVSVYALVAGLAGTGATFTTHGIALAGVAASVAGALSMGLGEYVSTKSQAQYYESEERR